MQLIKNFIRENLPPHLYTLYYVHRHYSDDPIQAFKFLMQGRGYGLTWRQRFFLWRMMYATSLFVDCPHAQQHILAVFDGIFNAPPGCVVEAGSFKGGSTAKFSQAAALTNRRLYAFDSFEGIPTNEELHDQDIFGRHVGGFRAGSYRGPLEEVQHTVRRFGVLEQCRFIKGWFDETMPTFQEQVAVAYIDVDLASSTRTCLKYLYPLLVPGGMLFSQDGHLPRVIEVFADESLWRDELGVEPPPIEGLGQSIMIKVVKPL